MKINIKKLIDKNWIVEEYGKNTIKTYYKIKRNWHNLKPFVLKKEIIIDEFFSECTGLYFGDGKLTPNDLMHTQFTNKDIDLCSKILRWFNYIGAKKSDMTFIIAYNKGRIDDIESDIRKHLKLFSQKIGRRKTDRNKYPTFAIQVNGKVFRILLEKIMKTSLGYIKKKSKLRRAWLRGYFAAEGCVAYHSTERYLASVSFAYNPKTEVWLRNYCLELLKLEGIKSQISIRHENSNGSVIKQPQILF